MYRGSAEAFSLDAKALSWAAQLYVSEKDGEEAGKQLHNGSPFRHQPFSDGCHQICQGVTGILCMDRRVIGVHYWNLLSETKPATEITVECSPVCCLRDLLPIQLSSWGIAMLEHSNCAASVLAYCTTFATNLEIWGCSSQARCH